ncbi:FtsX-like permease family protein [Demequina sp. NBRC 110056]|uniref:FtsX-like permease family protein n=1 Tax=Demequina sp. NBRC 110056 TaxID=1570345 RepID=UPI0009FE1F64|nr:FtsX-like permease family protein [Demequina sp. NBRC 110056]
MTWTLLREQIRSQRGYLATALAMTVAAVALATYALLVAATQAEVDARTQVLGQGYEWSTDFPVATARYASTDEGSLTPTEVDELVTSASASDDDFTLSATAERRVSNVSTGAVEPLEIATWAGTVDWSGIILEGRAPGDGEVLLSPAAAGRLDVAIGDTVAVAAMPSDDVARDLELTVSGLSHGEARAPVQVRTADAHTSWVELVPLSEVQSARSGWVTVGWSGRSATWDELGERIGWSFWADQGIPSNTTTFVSGLLMLAVVLGAVGAALGLGRAQAQARAAWVGTARALGATRTSVTRAGILDAGLLAVLGAILGWTLGWLAVVISLAAERAAGDAPALPVVPPVPSWAVTWPVVAGVFIACCLALAPALWARSVTPASALQPRPVGESERRVLPTWAWWTVLAGATALYVLPSGRSQHGALVPISESWSLGASTWTALGLALIASVALAARLTRLLVARIATRLDAGSAPWAIAASAALTGRPRTAATAGLTVMPWALAVTLGVSAMASSERVDLDPAWLGYLSLGVLPGIVVVTIAMLADRVSLRATAAEWASMGALGLTSRAARIAAGARFAASGIAGAAAGSASGAGLALLLSLWGEWTGIESASFGDTLVYATATAVVTAFVGTVLVAVATPAAAAASSPLVRVRVDGPTPDEQPAHDQKAGVR